jgi:hypothetical protein
MKNLILPIFILLLNSCIVEDWDLNLTGKLQNTYLFDGYLNYSVSSTVLSNDGNVLICGNNEDFVSVIKTSVQGNLFWRKDYSIESSSYAFSLVQTENQDIFICGWTRLNYADAKEDIFLLKVNSKGDSIWMKTFGGKGFDYADCIISTSDGNLLIAGRSEISSAESYSDIYLIKLNYNGEIIWEKTYSDPGSEIPSHILETDGEYLITGNNQENEMDQVNQIYFLKVDNDGNKLWNKIYGANDWKWGYKTIETSNGAYLTCGNLTSNGYNQVLIFRTDKNGNFMNEVTYGEPFKSEIGYSIEKNKDNSYTIVGSSFEVNKSETEIILLKIDENYREIYFERFGASKFSLGFNLLKYAYGNVITGNYKGKIFMFFLSDNFRGN